MSQELFKALDVYMARNHKALVKDGKVVNVNQSNVQVRVAGSGQVQQADHLSNVPISAGDDVVMLRPERRARWVIIGTISSPASGERASQRKSEELQISPPNNVRVEQLIPGRISVVWDAPYSQAVAIDVQTSATGSNEDAANVLTTRGSYCIIDNGTNPIYFRVRSASTVGKFSAWTNWILAEPTLGFDPDLTGYIDFPFNYNTPDARIIRNLGGGSFLRTVKLIVEEEFDGSIKYAVGQQGNRERFFEYGDGMPQVAGVYELDPMIFLPDETDIRLYLTGFATTGSGRILLYF